MDTVYGTAYGHVYIVHFRYIPYYFPIKTGSPAIVIEMKPRSDKNAMYRNVVEAVVP